MKIKTIASGSKGNSYLVDTGEMVVAIEAGVPWKKFLARADAMPDYVLVSHEHG